MERGPFCDFVWVQSFTSKPNSKSQLSRCIRPKGTDQLAREKSIFLRAPGVAWGLGAWRAGGGRIGLMSPFQDRWGQVVSTRPRDGRSPWCGPCARLPPRAGGSRSRPGRQDPRGSLRGGSFLLPCSDFLHPGSRRQTERAIFSATRQNAFAILSIFVLACAPGLRQRKRHPSFCSVFPLVTGGPSAPHAWQPCGWGLTLGTAPGPRGEGRDGDPALFSAICSRRQGPPSQWGHSGT